MPLPVVTRETRDRVFKEFGSYVDESAYFEAMTLRIRNEDGGAGRNPIIANFLCDILLGYDDKDLATYMVTFGLIVYRMIELTIGENTMPKVGKEIGAPLQVEFFKDIHRYCKSLGIRVMNQNRQITLACAAVCGSLALSDNLEERKIPVLTMATGLMVYRFIESQYESNEMTKSFT